MAMTPRASRVAAASAFHEGMGRAPNEREGSAHQIATEAMPQAIMTSKIGSADLDMWSLGDGLVVVSFRAVIG